MTYTPSKEILQKYANVLVNFALESGTGVKPKQTVFINAPEVAKPLLVELRNAVLRAGAYPIINFQPDLIAKEHFELASDDQLAFYAKSYYQGIVDQTDCMIFILGDVDPHELESITPEKLMLRRKAMLPYFEARKEKEVQGKYTWTLAIYGTQGLADEAKLSLEDYWNQIISACYLNTPDPVARWKEAYKEVDRLKDKLTSMRIKTLHVQAPETDLTVGIGYDRKWLGGSGRNVPSFEVFISPDWRVTNGTVYFSEPLYYMGTMIKDIRLEFKNGEVIKSSASVGENYLKEMLELENSKRLGEFSLTDSRLSNITKFMAHTLFDENIGGENGNMHLALGSCFKESYPGNAANVSEDVWAEHGYNIKAGTHTDIITTTNRTVTATLEDGSDVVIYKDGKFTV